MLVCAVVRIMHSPGRLKHYVPVLQSLIRIFTLFRG